MRFDDQLAINQLETFSHAGQAESPALTRDLDVEPRAFITNNQVDGVPDSAKMHLETPRLTVSYSVVQGFLKDSEETEGQRRRYVTWNVLVAEVNLDVSLSRELPAETAHCGHHAQMQQPWRVELV